MEKVGEILKDSDLLNQEKPAKQTGSPEFCEVHNLEHGVVGKGGRYAVGCRECWEEEQRLIDFHNRVREANRGLCLPGRLKEMDFDNYSLINDGAKKAHAACRNFASGGKFGLLLLGGVGTGKTHLAVSICKAFCSRGITADLTTTSEIIRRFRSTWGGKRAVNNWGDVITEETVISEYSTVGLLVIDEIGSQYGTDGERVVISEIVNNRYNYMLPVVAIGNVTLTQAQNYMGERVIDRLKHNGAMVVFDWESYRK